MIYITKEFRNWEWYSDINTTRLFLHLLFNASEETRRWCGIDILPGQVLTSIRELSKETKLSVQVIRTSLAKLQHGHAYIKVQIIPKHSIITICDFENYVAT